MVLASASRFRAGSYRNDSKVTLDIVACFWSVTTTIFGCNHKNITSQSEFNEFEKLFNRIKVVHSQPKLFA